MILEVKDGCFGYFGQPVIFDHINLSLEKGHILAILGPNGIGKTTLLKCMIGLLPWKRGQTLLNGQNIAKMKPADVWKTVSYIPQSHGFAFSYTGLEMVLLGRSAHLGMFQQPGKEELEMAEAMMERVGISHLANKDCNRMSGGELQMVLIARALINNPDILLADEPTGALDSETSIQVMELLKEIAKDKLVIMVTHNPELAEQYANRIVRIKDGTLTGDSNPYTPAKEDVPVAAKKERVSMSFFTAVSLSLNNLLTKKGRTILTASYQHGAYTYCRPYPLRSCFQKGSR